MESGWKDLDELKSAKQVFRMKMKNLVDIPEHLEQNGPKTWYLNINNSIETKYAVWIFNL